MKILALINARSGSKGVPGKNIKPLAGKPLITYSIETAKQCPSLNRIVVSTDTENIAAIARAAGAETPFLRPAELATDEVLQIDVLIHAVRETEKQSGKWDFICLLQPTCPLRLAEDVEGALKLLIDSKSDSVITITDVGGRHPRTLYNCDIDGRLEAYLPSPAQGVRRQQFENLYWRTGGVYAMRRDVLMNERSLYGQDVRGYMVPEERAFNIDSLFDWSMCDAWLQYKAKNP